MLWLPIITVILSVVFIVVGVVANVTYLYKYKSGPLETDDVRFFYTYMLDNLNNSKYKLLWARSTWDNSVKSNFLGGCAMCALGCVFGFIGAIACVLQMCCGRCQRFFNVMAPLLFALACLFFLVATALAAVMWTSPKNRTDPNAWLGVQHVVYEPGNIKASIGPGFILTIVAFVGFLIVFLLSLVFSCCCNTPEYTDMDADYDSRSAASSRSGTSAASSRSGTTGRTPASRASRESRGGGVCCGKRGDVAEDDESQYDNDAESHRTGDSTSQGSYASRSTKEDDEASVYDNYSRSEM